MFVPFIILQLDLLERSYALRAELCKNPGDFLFNKAGVIY